MRRTGSATRRSGVGLAGVRLQGHEAVHLGRQVVEGRLEVVHLPGGMVAAVVAVVADGAPDGLAAVPLDVLGPIDDVIDEILGVIDDVFDQPGDAAAPALSRGHGRSPRSLAPTVLVPLPIEHYTPRRRRQ